MFCSIFCNVENFFFISLAIIFILVLLLVYLFKQRISTVEKTGNTMFDMVRRLTDEVKWLKGFSKEEEKCVIGSPDTTIPISKSIPEKQVDMSAQTKDVVRDTIHFEIVEPVPGVGPDSKRIVEPIPGVGPDSKRIVVEDLGDSDDDESEESDSDDESDEESDSDDEESDVDDVSIGGMEIEIEVENLDSDQPVQLVNIDSDDVGEEVEITVDDIHEFEGSASASVAETKEVAEPVVHSVDDLKKMDVRQLRQIAFQKTGQDVSKTKKNELVRMLTVTVSVE
jgi:hypothetical protein